MSANSKTSNPFDELIAECQNDPGQIQARYEAHRFSRNLQQKEQLLDPSFAGWQVDEILKRLHEQAENEQTDAAAGPIIDPRHSLTILARPPRHIRDLVAEIQQEIRNVAPSLWFTPPNYLHMTTLEIARCRTKPEIEDLTAQLERSGIIPQLVDYAFYHRTRLIKPVISYDATAMALSFIPQAGGDMSHSRENEYYDDQYTYHHLRRDVSAQIAAIGLPMKPRYIAPSAHLTIARFITREGFLLKAHGFEGEEGKVDRDRVASLIKTREGEWMVGQERGLEICIGRSFYGGGECNRVGKGF